jgi:5-methylthioadenosine/S-adenosylhomocysteine deaminase
MLRNPYYCQRHRAKKQPPILAHFVPCGLDRLTVWHGSEIYCSHSPAPLKIRANSAQNGQIMSKTTIDLAISAEWIIPVVPRERVLQQCSVLIREDKIFDIVPDSALESAFEVKQHVSLPGQALIPGLINSHGHAAMSLLRGYADDYPLMQWLEEHIWPAEAKWVDEEFVETGTEIAIAEMLLSGTTCFSDMYFFPNIAAKTALDTGIRAQIAFPVLDFPTNWANDADDYLSKGIELHDAYRSIDRINIAFGPHAPYTVSDPALSRIVTLAEELQSPIQIHLHETEFEISQSIQQFGCRPIERLNKLGLLSPLTQCVHMTQVSDEDLALLQQTQAHVVHCPDSNLKLASGLCPVQSMLSAGVNVALGTDGAASNNDLSLIREMQQSALLAKFQQNNAAALDAHTALELATINGAKALGLADKLGSIEAGKLADLCAIDLRGIACQPVYKPVSQIVYAQSQVSNVWVGGKHLVAEGQLLKMNASSLSQKAQQWRTKIVGA